MFMSYYAMLRRHRADGRQCIVNPVSIMRWTPKWYEDLHLPVFKMIAPAEDHEYKGWEDFKQNYEVSVLYPLSLYKKGAFTGQAAVVLELIEVLDKGRFKLEDYRTIDDINNRLRNVTLLGYEETERLNERNLIGPWFESAGIICKEWDKVEDIP